MGQFYSGHSGLFWFLYVSLDFIIWTTNGWNRENNLLKANRNLKDKIKFETKLFIKQKG